MRRWCTECRQEEERFEARGGVCCCSRLQFPCCHSQNGPHFPQPKRSAGARAVSVTTGGSTESRISYVFTYLRKVTLLSRREGRLCGVQHNAEAHDLHKCLAIKTGKKLWEDQHSKVLDPLNRRAGAYRDDQSEVASVHGDK